MSRRVFCFLLCMLMTLNLFGCARSPGMEETDSQNSSEVGAVTKKPGVGEDGITKDIYTLPHASSQRNIPEGSNVRQVDGKWIIAANMDRDYYLDSSQTKFFILSEEPFDYKQVTVTVDVGNEVAGLQYYVGNLAPNDGVTTLDLTKDTYFCYAGFDFRYYRAAEKKYWTSLGLPDDPGSSDVDIPNTEEFQAAYERYVEVLDSYQRLADEALPQFYAYYMYISFWDFEEELTINEITVSWPGVEETIDIGQIRLHPESLYFQYPDTAKAPGVDWGAASHLGISNYGQIFGPELADLSLTWNVTEEIIIKNVYCLNESCPVVAVRVKNTTPGVDDVVTLSDDSPVIVSPEARATIQIYFTGPHRSELNVCAQGYFVIEYECGGVDYQVLCEEGIVPGRVSTAYMMLFDMVDLQGYAENVLYAPDQDAELYELIGWTDEWARRYS